MPIMFEKDWRNSDGKLVAIPHMETKNESFLRTCHLLKKMGIKNHLFPLALYDPDLRNVDVHDLQENTPENERLRTKVQIEARRNIWYFMREVIRIYNQGGSPVPFKLNRGSLAMLWVFSNNIHYATMQPRQSGKQGTLDSLIKTPSGWTRMGDIKLGDKVSVPDGTTSTVTGVFPQGKLPTYRFYFEDGRFTDVGEEHLWKVYWAHWGEADGGKWRVLTTRQIIDHMELHKRSKNHLAVPLVVHEIKDDVDLPVDPYVLGVILGDGCISDKSVSICKPDNWMRLEVGRLLPSGYNVSDYHSCGKSFSIRRTVSKEVPAFRKLLEPLGIMGRVSYTKFIPDIYMNGSESQKWALLQGLFDTDGTVNKTGVCLDGVTPKRGSIEYSTTSIVLAKQVQELIRSLGGLCKITERQTYYTHNGEKKKGRISYRVTPRIRDVSRLFRMPRKKELAEVPGPKDDQDLRLSIREVSYIGEHEAQCIEIDHPEHLYITDDYIVTHNTVAALSIYTWILFCSGQETQLGMMAKDNKLREDNVARIKRLAECLPDWWIAKSKFKDKSNATFIRYDALKTELSTLVAQDSPVDADNQGRGGTMPTFWWDEFDFTANIGISYSTIFASGGAARVNAKANGQPHSNLITTTAGDPAKKACQEAAKIMNGCMAFTEQLYDVEDYDKLHEVVNANSSNKMILGVFSHLQLGLSNEWLRNEIRQAGMSPDKVMREYLNRRVSIQEQPIIPKDILARINSSRRDPKWTEIVSGKFLIYWYLDKETVKSPAFRNRPIVVGCDSSEMIGRDATTLVGIDPSDLSTVFTFCCNEANINTVGAMIAHLMLMYPNITLVPENKSSGTSIIDSVSLILREHNHNPFTRMFNWIVNNSHEEPFNRMNIHDPKLADTTAKRHFGIKTDKAKRDQLYSDVLFEGTAKACDVIHDQRLIDEFNSLTSRNGRVDHEVGSHDDTVIGWLMAVWMILYGKHLSAYGIKPGQVMTRLKDTKTADEQKRAQHEKTIRERLEGVLEALKFQKDPIYRKMLEADARALKSMISDDLSVTPTNADALLRDPRRYTDQKVAEASHDPISIGSFENTMRAVLNLN